MKVYLFDRESGLYQGETCVEAGMVSEEGMTTDAPPRYEPGQVAVFDRQRRSWELLSISVTRQLLNLSAAPGKEKRG